MASSRFSFRPGLVPTLATLFLFPVLVALGFWQLDRARQAIRLREQIDAHAHGAAVVVGQRLLPAARLRYYRVIARGRYDIRHQFLLDNQVHNGFAGYDVITPLRIAGGDTRILVNRGWVPLGPDRQHLPQIATPSGEQRVEGVAVIPDAHYFALARPRPIAGRWPAVWEYLDMRRFRRAVPFPVQPAVLQLDPGSAAGGFVRKWARPDGGVTMHQSYAGQWFLMAVALLVIFVWVNIRRVVVDPDEAHHGIR